VSRSLPTCHSLPTRRSSDLDPSLWKVASRLAIHARIGLFDRIAADYAGMGHTGVTKTQSRSARMLRNAKVNGLISKVRHCDVRRSEEHTSELQSREKLVCRL